MADLYLYLFVAGVSTAVFGFIIGLVWIIDRLFLED